MTTDETSPKMWNFQLFANHYQIHRQSLLKHMRRAGIINNRNEPTPEWEPFQQEQLLKTQFGEKTQRYWDVEKVLKALGTELDGAPIHGSSNSKRKNNRRAIRPYDPSKIPFEMEQPKCLIHFLKIGVTQGGRGFTKTLQDQDLFEMLFWTEDPSSDIPFFYIKFKSSTEEEERASLQELDAMIDAAKKREKITVDPTGTNIDCIIVPIKHDGTIHWNGNPPSKKALPKIKELCDTYNIWEGMSFGGTSCAVVGLPWED